MKPLERNQVPAPVREKMDSFGFRFAQVINTDKYEGAAYELFPANPEDGEMLPTGLPVVVVYSKDKCRLLTPDESYSLLRAEE